MFIKHIYTIALCTLFASGLAYANYTELTTMGQYKTAFNSNEPTIIMYSSPSCSPCKAMKPHFNALSAKYPQVRFYVIDTANASFKGLTKQLSISGLPTTIMSKGGKEVKRERGGMSKVELDRSIGQFLKSL
jgi:thioredoxin 2